MKDKYKDKRKTRVSRLSPLEDERGRYIPYCDYGWHQGIPFKESVPICEERNCNHYHKLYIPWKYKVVIYE